MNRFLQNFKIVFFYELLTEKELEKVTNLIENTLKNNNIKTSKIISEINLEDSMLYQKIVNNSDKIYKLENLNYIFKGDNIDFSCNSKMFSIYFNKLANFDNIWKLLNIIYESFLREEYLSLKNIYINKTISVLFTDVKALNQYTKLKIKLAKNSELKQNKIKNIDNYTETEIKLELSEASLDNKNYLLLMNSYEIKKDLFIHKTIAKDIKYYLGEFEKLNDVFTKMNKEIFKEIKDEEIKNYHGIKILGEYNV